MIKFKNLKFICLTLILTIGVSLITSQNIFAATTKTAYTAKEVNLLARLITAEAQGEPYIVQVAVGAVVLNRVKSSRFPNSITAVINQHVNNNYQFSPVRSGIINRPATASALKAAYAALNGTDPTKKALFFSNITSNSKAILARSGSIKLYNLIFTR